MPGAQRVSFSSPDETRSFTHGTVQFVKIGGGTIRRIRLEPGWRWSQDMGPTVGTKWCEASHFQYHLSGRLHVLMEDGTELDIGPGDISFLPKGHDSWVVGEEAVMIIDWYRVSEPARSWDS
jgi:hypothetical protein